MARQTELERYEEWRSEFSLSEQGPHVFRNLDKLRRIENITWGTGTDEDKIVEISAVLSE